MYVNTTTARMLCHLYLMLTFCGLNCSHEIVKLQLKWNKTQKSVSEHLWCARNEEISKIYLNISYVTVPPRRVKDVTDSSQWGNKNATANCEADIKKTLKNFNVVVKRACQGQQTCQVTLGEKLLTYICRPYAKQCENQDNITQKEDMNCLATKGTIFYKCKEKPKKLYLGLVAVVVITTGVVLTSVTVTLITTVGIYCCCKRQICSKPKKGGDVLKAEEEEEVVSPSIRVDQLHKDERKGETSFWKSENIYQEIHDTGNPVTAMVNNSSGDSAAQAEPNTENVRDRLAIPGDVHLLKDIVFDNADHPETATVKNESKSSDVVESVEDIPKDVHLSKDSAVDNNSDCPVTIIMVENSTYDGGLLNETESDIIGGERMSVAEEEHLLENSAREMSGVNQLPVNTAEGTSTQDHGKEEPSTEAYSKESSTEAYSKESSTEAYSKETTIDTDETRKNSLCKTDDGNAEQSEYVYAYGHFKQEGRERESQRTKSTKKVQ